MVSIHETVLRKVVKQLYEEDSDNVLVKIARRRAEEELELEPSFFKDDIGWSSKSKEIVKDEFEKLEARDNKQDAVSSPAALSKAPSKSTASGSTSKKRPSDAVLIPEDKPSKRSKKKPSPSSGTSPALTSDHIEAGNKSDFELSEASSNAANVEAPATKAAKRMPKQDPTPKNAKPSKPQKDPTTSKTNKNERRSPGSKPTEQDQLLASSDLSDVQDDPAPPKRKKKSPLTTSNTKAKSKSKPKKPTSAPPTDLTPDEAEIKRLQSWLLKCGIRKIWAIELKKLDTANERITHLKEMLRDVGMEGRFLEEKAREIKEKREMAKDLEDIRKGNEVWGHDEGEDEKGRAAGGVGGGGHEGEKPKRKLASGLQQLAVFDGDEESD